MTTYPLVRMGFLFMGGILYYHWVGNIHWIILLASIGLYGLAELFLPPIDRIVKFQSVILNFTIFLFGCWWVSNHEAKIEREKLPTGSCLIQGVLLEKPVLKYDFYRVRLQTRSWENHLKYSKTVQAAILLYVPEKDSQFYQLQPGDKIRFSGFLQVIPRTSNPGAFDKSQFYRRMGILHQAYIKSGEWDLQEKVDPQNIEHVVFRQREQLLSKIDRFIQGRDERGVVKALLLGNKEDVSHDINQNFSSTGAIHVLAVSGLHVGAVLYLFVLSFRLLSRRLQAIKYFRPIVLGMIALLYALLTGASPSVSRAALMFFVVIIGKEWFRETNTINILMISAIWMLLYDPLLLYNLSFQFSYLSLAGILLFHEYIRVWFIPSNPLSSFIWGIVSVSIAAQILVFPMALYYFNQFPVYFILSNIIAIPLAVGLVYGGFLLFFLDSFDLSSFSKVTEIYESFVTLLLQSIQSMASWPASVIDKIWVEPWMVILLYTVIFCFYMYQCKGISIWFYLSLSLIMIAMMHMFYRDFQQGKQIKMCVYDVKRNWKVDFFTGYLAFTTSGDTLEPQIEKMICYKNRVKHGIRQNVQIKKNEKVRSNHFFYENYQVSMLRGKIYFLQETEVKYDNMYHADVFFITAASGLPDARLRQYERKTLFIICNDLKKWKRDQWLACLTEWNIPFHDVKSRGYIEINF